MLTTHHNLWWDCVSCRRCRRRRRGVGPCRERDDDRSDACSRDHFPALESGSKISRSALRSFIYETL